MKKFMMSLINLIIPSDYVILKKGEIIDSKEFFVEAFNRSVGDFKEIKSGNNNHDCALDFAKKAREYAESIGADIGIQLEKISDNFNVEFTSGWIVSVSGSSGEFLFEQSNGIVFKRNASDHKKCFVCSSPQDIVRIASGIMEIKK